MIKSEKKLDIFLFGVIAVLILAYIFGIFFVNFNGKACIDYDMYSDMMFAKYMAQEKTLFPDGWHFGNQIYVVATPVVAGCLYPLVKDSYTAMAMASCLMTLLVIASFLWCIKPFSGMKNAAVGLLVLIGGTNIGWTAHKDLEGLQVFYTMASYYACYIIGIFLTLGCYCRYFQGIPVKKLLLFAAVLLNLALGMQSLRETLVLNLPLCAAVLLQILLNKFCGSRIDANPKKAYFFAAATLLSNISGVILSKFLARNGVFAQAEILQETHPRLLDNVQPALSAFAQYIGLTLPNDLFTGFRFAAALLSIFIVVLALASAAAGWFRKKESAIGFGILFFLISLGAVFAAGVLVLSLRPIYYFCWYLLVAFSAVYLLEITWNRRPGLLDCLKKLLALALICVSMVNFKFLFQYSALEIADANAFYGSIAQQLQEEGTQYLYSDSRTEQPMIAAMTNDDVVYVTLIPSGDPEDLWKPLSYLYMDDWFDPDNYENAYILLSDYAWGAMERNFSPEYRKAFMENLQPVQEFHGSRNTLTLYRGTPKMYRDILDGTA